MSVAIITRVTCLHPVMLQASEGSIHLDGRNIQNLGTPALTTYRTPPLAAALSKHAQACAHTYLTFDLHTDRALARHLWKCTCSHHESISGQVSTLCGRVW